MADSQSVAMLIDSTESKIQQLQQAFSELESFKAVSLNLKWKELEEHFHGLESSLRKRLNELEVQEKEFETKAFETREMLEKRESVVVAKENAFLEGLQEKRDAAFLAVGNALQKYKNAVEDPFVSNVSEGNIDAMLEGKQNDKAAMPHSVLMISAGNDSRRVNPRPELIKLCEEMDAKGLHKFISDNRKNLAALKEEIPFALKKAADPGRLILDSLGDFYPTEITFLDGKRDSGLLGIRRTCIMLMESLFSMLVDSESSLVGDYLVISSAIKEQAKAIADEWKPKLDHLDFEACNGNSLEAHAFLQLLATFGIATDFNQSDILKLIPLVSRRHQTADLCRSLGLTQKMPDVIEVLMNSGQQLEAVNLSYAFGLTDKFDPVSLLKAYLKEARKGSQIKGGNASPTAKNEAEERELSALKVVIKSIEEHKLEQQYPIDPLQKRIVQLEKAKADKKRAAEASKLQSKRPRANVSSYVPHIINIPENCGYRTSERYPYVYERPYVYATDNHGPSLLGSAFYSPTHSHGSYYANGYQYPTQYLH